ncbi:MAG: PTS fructose transporter subunit IIB [Candidatus Nanohaloarchaea archaeon]|nr:PTS fructose transporter subunit IIB [Candidatus Nanohaloarchaea archaeon]
MKFLAVTSCPTGIAHSEMAAESLEEAAEDSEHEIKVEIRGSIGTENELTDEDIEEADAVIIAADISVPTDRFGDKPRVKVGVQKAVTHPEAVLDAAVKKAKGEDVELEEADEDMKSAAIEDATGSFIDKIKSFFQ